MMKPEEFKEDVQTWAKQIGVQAKEIHIRTMSRKWASCSSKGRLTFDTSLLEESKEIRLKTILHELLHLKYPNHGRMFNILLTTYLKKAVKRDEDKRGGIEKVTPAVANQGTNSVS